MGTFTPPWRNMTRLSGWIILSGLLHGQTFTTITTNMAGAYARGTPSAILPGTDGNFYVAVSDGGSLLCNAGCGTLLKVTPAGSISTLYSFDFADGALPQSLVAGNDGMIYGTTNDGGAGAGSF